MTTATQSLNLDPNAISKRAYEIWESLGCPEGVADQTWAEAVRQLSSDAAQTKPNANCETPCAKTTSAAPVETETVEARVERATPVEARAETAKPSSDLPSSPNVTASEKKNQNSHRRGSRR